MRWALPIGIVSSTLSAACAQSPPAGAAGQTRQAEEPITCADSDLAARSAMPPGTECVGSAYSLPSKNGAHHIAVFHLQKRIPFTDFEGHYLKVNAKSNAEDIALMNARLTGFLKSEILGVKKTFEERGFIFRWLGNYGAAIKDFNDFSAGEFSSPQYPEGQCLHAKFEATGDFAERTSTATTHSQTCWTIDFDNRRVVVEVVNYMDTLRAETGLAPLPAFDAEAAAFFRSLRPPQS